MEDFDDDFDDSLGDEETDATWYTLAPISTPSHYYLLPPTTLATAVTKSKVPEEPFSYSRFPFFVADGFLTLLAIASNFLVVLAVSKTKLSTPNIGYHRFFSNFSVACLITTSTIALSFVHEITIQFLPHPVLTRRCGETFLRGLMNIGYCGALLSIAGLTLDSFVGLFSNQISYLKMTRNRSRQLNIAIWVIALGFGITDLPLSVIHFFSTGGHKAPRSRDVDFFDWCAVYIANKYRLEYMLLGSSWPCFVFLVGTLVVLIVKQRSSDRKYRRFIITTIMLMSLFAIFWMPYANFDVPIVIVGALISDQHIPNESRLDFFRCVLRTWLLFGNFAMPLLYAFRFRRRIRRQLVDFFTALCEGEVNLPEIEEDEGNAPTIRHLLASTYLVVMSSQDPRGSIAGGKDESRQKALQRVKSCRM